MIINTSNLKCLAERINETNDLKQLLQIQVHLDILKQHNLSVKTMYGTSIELEKRFQKITILTNILNKKIVNLKSNKS